MNASQIQSALNRAGASPRLIVDGKIGPATKAALRAFQASVGLRVTGLVDTRTIQALQAASRAVAAPAGSPRWLDLARAELGVRETPGQKSTERIIEYRSIGRTASDQATEDGSRPWCADFANAMLELAGVSGTASGMAQSFARSDRYVRLDGPASGAIVVFWRKTRTSGLGHVGFYVGEDARRVFVVGGNQGDAVTIAGFAKDARTFGVLGYFWPAAEPLPEIGALPYLANAESNPSMT